MRVDEKLRARVDEARAQGLLVGAGVGFAIGVVFILLLVGGGAA
jgi:hypothetical protein